MISNLESAKQAQGEALKNSSSQKKEVGLQGWLKVREEWTKKENEKAKTFAKSKPISDSYRHEVAEIIRSVKPPYPQFKHYISLEDMVDVLMEVLEEDED